MAVSHKPNFAPGKGEEYSSTNYILAGLIVEKVTGHSIGIELRNRIFRPLHLSDTSYPTTPAIPGPHAHGYFVLEHPPRDRRDRDQPVDLPVGRCDRRDCR